MWQGRFFHLFELDKTIGLTLIYLWKLIQAVLLRTNDRYWVHSFVTIHTYSNPYQVRRIFLSFQEFIWCERWPIHSVKLELCRSSTMRRNVNSCCATVLHTMCVSTIKPLKTAFLYKAVIFITKFSFHCIIVVRYESNCLLDRNIKISCKIDFYLVVSWELNSVEVKMELETCLAPVNK